MKDSRIPDEVRQHFGKWIAAGSLSNYFMLNGVAPASFVQRLKAAGNNLGGRQVRTDSRGLAVKHYAVKRVVAAALAHGLTVSGPSVEALATPAQREALAALRQELASVREALALLKSEREASASAVAEARAESKRFRKEVLDAIRALPKDRNVRGVYFVFHADILSYIGSADKVSERLDHPTFELADVRVLPVSDGADHRAVERFFIRALRPPLNRAHNPARTHNGAGR